MFIDSRKKGFSFINSIFTLFLILAVFNLCLIFINYNYSKGKSFKVYSDVKTLSKEDENFLLFINNNIDKFITFNFNDLKKTNTSFANYSFEMLNNKYYMTKRKDNDKMYIELEKIINGTDTKFIPKYYKTQYIVGAAKNDN